MRYAPPIADQRFTLDVIADVAGLAKLAPFDIFDPELVPAILEESGRLAAGTFAPLNRIGDEVGAIWRDGNVTMPPGFQDAYRSYVEGAWGTLAADPLFGGQGMPFVLACAVQEQLISANSAAATCMMLTQGAIEALHAHASDALKALYLPRLISGAWTGTMNLTEPQAGSDVGALRTMAHFTADGSWRLKGQKIFITCGEHDLSENIIHLVLARTPGAPPGTKGISLFLVPKFLVDDAGTPGPRNDARCLSIERKLGIHASPTCTMAFGERDACVAYLIGDECGGMRTMFTMMNHARVTVGVQGVAIAERAYQLALGYARERVQGKRIIEYPDVRRMLMTMKALTEASRALTYLNASAVDRGRSGAPDAKLLADLLTPITKAYATDIGVEVADLAIQVFGGMGFIEETGAAQHLRDARIAPIYEGTNGIQAMDLVTRKLPQGRWVALLAEMRDFADGLETPLTSLRGPLGDAIDALERATLWMVGQGPGSDIASGASSYLRMFGVTLGGYLLARKAQAAAAILGEGGADRAFLEAKIGTACFFAEQFLPQVPGMLRPTTSGSDALFALNEAQLAL